MLLEFNIGILHRILDDISQSALEHFYKEHLQRMSIECGHAFLEEIASLSVCSFTGSSSENDLRCVAARTTISNFQK